MNSNYIVVFLIFLFSLLLNEKSHSQSAISKDSVNLFDSKGKKDGIWIEYLSENFKIVKNTKDAAFYRYVRFQHGILFDPPILKRNIYRIEPAPKHKTNTPLQLNGEYNVYFIKNNKLSMTCVFNNGYLEKLIGYDINGNIEIEINNTSKYNNIECSDLKTYYNEKGEITNQTYEILENSEWRTVRIK